MAGYRDTSNYEPYGAMNSGRPLRPFNWVQWTGVAIATVGLAIDLLYFAGRLAWTPTWVANPSIAMPAIILGIVLINSRRDPAADPAPELAAQRRRWLIIVAAICLPILGVAAVLALQGA